MHWCERDIQTNQCLDNIWSGPYPKYYSLSSVYHAELLTSHLSPKRCNTSRNVVRVTPILSARSRSEGQITPCGKNILPNTFYNILFSQSRRTLRF